MTFRNELYSIKTIAKRLARAKRIAHHEALDLVANELGHSHWNSLTIASVKGWKPEPAQWEALERLSNANHLNVVPTILSGLNSATLCVEDEQGSIDGQAYTLTSDLAIQMQGRGWAILIEQAPSEAPQIEVTDRRVKANPILNPEFVSQALAIGNAAAEKLRSHIAADWPRRSTKPDAEGRALHPLFPALSSTWHCLHCDGAFTGAQMAANFWHCPECSATPIDIH